MTHKSVAPAEVLQDQGRGEKVENEACTNDFTARKAKRKLRNVWREGRRPLSVWSQRQHCLRYLEVWRASR